MPCVTKRQREDLTRLAIWVTFEQPELRRVIEEAVRTVEVFSRSEFWQQASEAEHALEVPLQFAESESSLLAGLIDLVFKHADIWAIVDYKTDIDLGEELAALHYTFQLAAYQKELASCGVPNNWTSIWPLRVGGSSAEMKD